jgi:hypothetical protein
MSRGTSNTNSRGNSRDRARRRQWLLDQFGDGATARCALRLSQKCLEIVTLATVSADRINPGRDGGGYVRGNIQPACMPCQSYQGWLMMRGVKDADVSEVSA